MNFKEKLLDIGLNVKDFSEITNTPLPTVRGWTTKRRNKTPKWVNEYIKLYKENRDNEILINRLLKEKMNEKS